MGQDYSVPFQQNQPGVVTEQTLKHLADATSISSIPVADFGGYALARTPAFAISQSARRKVEALFAELKNQVGLRRLRLRRMRFVREQFFLAATAQNLKRLVRFLSSKPTPGIATA
jgi:hypothetical protein